MLALPLYNKTDERFRLFGTSSMPLRPSALGKLVTCPMSVFLSYTNYDELGNKAAQTGNLVHVAAAEYHRTAADPQAGLDALQAAREKFPGGDVEKATKIFASYAKDKKNQEAEVVWIEEPVRLVLEDDIVIQGTLDQVRRTPQGLSVWDIKTGEGKDAEETLDEYLIQQAAYTLAARETLDPSIQPGGIIYTPAYEKFRGNAHLPLKLSIERCKMLMLSVADAVHQVRQGRPAFRPSKGACEYCSVRPYSHCFSMFDGAYS